MACDRVMWFDAEANVWELSTREGVASNIARCKAAGIDTIVVDVKPLAGLTLYNSTIAPKLKLFEGKPYTEGYDLLQTVVEEGHKAGLEVHAAVNVFSEGSTILPGGPAFEHVDWQCVQYELRDGADALVRTGDLESVHNAVFVNPLHPEVRDYELSIIREICTRYEVDGIVPDRMRYPNLFADFSDMSRRSFESFLGHGVENWPVDIFKRNPSLGEEVVRGPLFKSWLKFRAGVIRDFLAQVRAEVNSTRPGTKLGIYVGSWYSVYYDVGVNWGSPGHVADLEWWPEGYEETGFADLVDYMCTGCYYPNVTRKEALEHGQGACASVEAAAEESMSAVEGVAPVFGSLYLYQYEGQPQQFLRAVRECLDKTHGCMLFDLVYIRKYDWWEILKEALSF